MILCQHCTAQNSLNRDFCWKCGTKLLVASGPQAFEFQPMGPFMDEHVLERISAVEYQISLLSRRLDSLVETIERLAASNFIDHTMIETLTESLESAGITFKSLEEEWRRRIDHKVLADQEAERLSARMGRILDQYRGADREQFSIWIDKATEYLLSQRLSEAIDMLESGHRNDRRNDELSLLLAEIYYQQKRFELAMNRLEPIREARPDWFEARLLLALITYRTGELREARKQFESALAVKEDSAAGHALLGNVLAESGDRSGALVHLNRALELNPNAAVHFLAGAVYYGAGDHKKAMDHLRRATKIDPEFSEAFYQLGLLCLEMNWLKKAQKYFKTAQSINPREGRYRRKMRSFARVTSDPERLHGLVREELRLPNVLEEERFK